MSSFMRTALQGNGFNNTTIIMDGPLSEQFTKALNIAYAKTDAVTGEAKTEPPGDGNNAGMEKQIRAITQESQQLDQHAEAGAIAVNQAMGATAANELRVYAVDADEVQNEDIVRFARMAVAAKIPAGLVLIAQKAQAQSTEHDNEHIDKALNTTDRLQETSQKATTLQLLASSFNVKTYTSLEAFQNDFFN